MVQARATGGGGHWSVREGIFFGGAFALVGWRLVVVVVGMWLLLMGIEDIMNGHPVELAGGGWGDGRAPGGAGLGILGIGLGATTFLWVWGVG